MKQNNLSATFYIPTSKTKQNFYKCSSKHKSSRPQQVFTPRTKKIHQIINQQQSQVIKKKTSAKNQFFSIQKRQKKPIATDYYNHLTNVLMKEFRFKRLPQIRSLAQYASKEEISIEKKQSKSTIQTGKSSNKAMAYKTLNALYRSILEKSNAKKKSQFELKVNRLPIVDRIEWNARRPYHLKDRSIKSHMKFYETQFYDFQEKKTNKPQVKIAKNDHIKLEPWDSEDIEDF